MGPCVEYIQRYYIFNVQLEKTKTFARKQQFASGGGRGEVGGGRKQKKSLLNRGLEPLRSPSPACN